MSQQTRNVQERNTSKFTAYRQVKKRFFTSNLAKKHCLSKFLAGFDLTWFEICGWRGSSIGAESFVLP